jgi:hypothetical protein
MCPDGLDTADLVYITERALGNKIDSISVAPEMVAPLWAWVENRPVKIITRFILENSRRKNDADISDLSENINMAFKRGANAIQIFIQYKKLGNFADAIAPVRDDLFFNRGLSVALDLREIDAMDWPDVFAMLGKLRADSVLFYVGKSRRILHDLVGRIYGMFENWGGDFSGDLHFAMGDDMDAMDNIWRLVEKMRPNIRRQIRFFISP